MFMGCGESIKDFLTLVFLGSVLEVSVFFYLRFLLLSFLEAVLEAVGGKKTIAVI